MALWGDFLRPRHHRHPKDQTHCHSSAGHWHQGEPGAMGRVAIPIKKKVRKRYHFSKYILISLYNIFIYHSISPYIKNDLYRYSNIWIWKNILIDHIPQCFPHYPWWTPSPGAKKLQRLALAVDVLRHNFQDVASVRIQVPEAGIAGKPHQLIPGWLDGPSLANDGKRWQMCVPIRIYYPKNTR